MTVSVIVCRHGVDLAKCDECSSIFPPQMISWFTYKRFQPQVGTYYVTSVVSCLRRAFYEFTRLALQTVESLWILHRGRMLHAITHAFGWRELPVSTPIDCNGERITLAGHVDAYDPDAGVIYDFKTTSYLKWQLENRKLPHQSHVNQLRAYDMLLSRYGLAVNRLELWYMDDKTPPTRIEVERQDIGGWLADRTRILHRSVRNGEEPAREESYICKFCLYLDICGSAT